MFILSFEIVNSSEEDDFSQEVMLSTSMWILSASGNDIRFTFEHKLDDGCLIQEKAFNFQLYSKTTYNSLAYSSASALEIRLLLQMLTAGKGMFLIG